MQLFIHVRGEGEGASIEMGSEEEKERNEQESVSTAVTLIHSKLSVHSVRPEAVNIGVEHRTLISEVLI